MRLGCIGVIIAAACLWGGGQKVYESFASGSKKSITIEQLIKEKPDVGWYRITGARWNATDAFYSQKKTTGEFDNELLILIYPKKGFEPGDKVHLLMRQSRPDVIPSLKQLAAIDTLLKGREIVRAANKEQPSREDIEKELKMIEQADSITAKFEEDGAIEGTIEFGIDSDDAERGRVEAAGKDIMAEDYMILRPGEQPSALTGFIMLAIGIAISIFMLWGVARPTDAED
ncbi:MAG: hypothetical protein R3E02_10205 [Blastomonas sp.]